MPTITIDGQVCEFEGKPNILQVALDNRLDIPHYCYHQGLSVVASCRICLAEVESPNPRNDNKLELIPKLVPTCQTPAADGMVVHTQSPKSVANQKAVMEYLLINHPLDCPVCDQAGECQLQDYSYEYGRANSRFEEDKIKQPKKDLGDHVLLYSDRCIMCTRCVRFTQEVSGTKELGVFGRGSSEQIDVFPGKPLNNPLSGNVIDICPVGALLDKDFLMSMRVWNLKRTPSIDGITASGDNLSIQTNEDKVYRIKPRTNLDVNRWWTSDEIRFGYHFVNREDRLTQAMTKSPFHKTLEPSTPKAARRNAIAGIKMACEVHGPGALAVLVSPMLPSEEAYLLGKLAVTLDPEAVLAVGPIPMQGDDQSFPGGYTITAEKAPNARGVRRALEQLSDNVLAYEDLLPTLGAGSGSSDIKAVIVTGNYPSEWVTPELQQAVDGKFVVLLDTLPGPLAESCDVLLPGSTWVEKSGCFENHAGRIQHFEQAMRPREGTTPEGITALELMHAAGLTARRGVYDVEALRREMGDAFVTDVHLPVDEEAKTSDVQYVQL